MQPTKVEQETKFNVWEVVQYNSWSTTYICVVMWISITTNQNNYYLSWINQWVSEINLFKLPAQVEK